LFVSTGLHAQPHPPRRRPTPPRVVCIHKGIHPSTAALNPTGLYISTWNPHLTTRAAHLIPSLVVCIHAGKTRHHGLCVVDRWTSSDVKRDQTFQSETDIELDMEQYITRHALVSITKRLLITSEDRAVSAFILVTSSASVTTVLLLRDIEVPVFLRHANGHIVAITTTPPLPHRHPLPPPPTATIVVVAAATTTTIRPNHRDKHRDQTFGLETSLASIL